MLKHWYGSIAQVGALAVATLTAFALVLAPAGTAFAQDDDDLFEDAAEESTDSSPSEDAESSDPLEFNDDSGAPAGADENPGQPALVREGAETKGDAPSLTEAGYPVDIVSRPLTLIGEMSQVSYAVVVDVDPFALSGVLTGEYGIDSRMQIGLRYGTGSKTEDTFEPGKAIAIDYLYLINDTMAAQVSMPIMLDPFAVALTLGAPMKFKATDNVALFVGRDLVTFKIAKFIPSISNAATNAGYAAAAEQNSTGLSDGEVAVKGGVIYQLSNNMALAGEFGFVAQDFEGDRLVVPLLAHLTFASSAKLDIGATAGFSDMSNASDNIGLSVFAAFRL